MERRDGPAGCCGLLPPWSFGFWSSAELQLHFSLLELYEVFTVPVTRDGPTAVGFQIRGVPWILVRDGHDTPHQRDGVGS